MDVLPIARDALVRAGVVGATSVGAGIPVEVEETERLLVAFRRDRPVDVPELVLRIAVEVVVVVARRVLEVLERVGGPAEVEIELAAGGGGGPMVGLGPGQGEVISLIAVHIANGGEIEKEDLGEVERTTREGDRPPGLDLLLDVVAQALGSVELPEALPCVSRVFERSLVLPRRNGDGVEQLLLSVVF